MRLHKATRGLAKRIVTSDVNSSIRTVTETTTLFSSLSLHKFLVWKEGLRNCARKGSHNDPTANILPLFLLCADRSGLREVRAA
jgi:hypothetical protein